MSATVSVVMAAYREAERIGAALDSLARQTRRPEEVLVVDDGSPDATAAIAESRGVRVIRTPHRGAGAARAAGAQAARGEILVFLDADETFPPRFIERLVEPIERGEAASTYPGEATFLDVQRGLAAAWLRLRGFGTGDPVRFTGTHPWPKALRREDLERAGGYPQVGYGEDLELGRRLASPATIVPAASYAASVPATPREVFRTARWIGRGPRRAAERPPLARALTPWSLLRAGRLLIGGRPDDALVRVLYDAGLLLGVAEHHLRPGVRDRA